MKNQIAQNSLKCKINIEIFFPFFLDQITGRGGGVRLLVQKTKFFRVFLTAPLTDPHSNLFSPAVNSSYVQVFQNGSDAHIYHSFPEDVQEDSDLVELEMVLTN